MKIGGSFTAFDISAKGLSMQRKKMNLIAENIANADMIRTENGEPYKRKVLEVTQSQSKFVQNNQLADSSLGLQVTNQNHLNGGSSPFLLNDNDPSKLKFSEKVDNQEGAIVHMPDHPDADENGYVETSNVNVINEMVDMIAASRSYEANLTAFNSSKQMAKDSLEI